MMAGTAVPMARRSTEATRIEAIKKNPLTSDPREAADVAQVFDRMVILRPLISSSRDAYRSRR